MRQIYIGLLVASCIAIWAQACASQPPPPRPIPSLALARQPVTVAAVPGDPDDIVAYTKEFLTGCNVPEGQATSQLSCSRNVLHLPAALQVHARHLHRDGLDDYTPFYLDETVLDCQRNPGKDTDADHGLEGANLLFYSGHGQVNSFDSLKLGRIQVEDFSLGDKDVRYLLMLSCNVFAHGPKVDGDFIHPESYSPLDPLGPDHADAFRAWSQVHDGRTPLNRGLRLACGGSSHIGNLDHPSHLLWHYYSLLGMGPAEAFLLGLYTPETSGIPLCMSRGDENPESSGLFDSRFVADRQRGPDRNSIYIEYPLLAAEDDSLLAEATRANALRYSRRREPRTDEPVGLPVLVVKAAPLPGFLGGSDLANAPVLDYGFRGDSAASLQIPLNFLVPANESPAAWPLDAADVCIKRHPASGTVIISFRPRARVADFSGESGWNLLQTMAKSVIQRVVSGAPGGSQGNNPSTGFVLHDAQPIEMRIDAVPAEQAALGSLQLSDLRHPKKCRYLRLTWVYREAGKEAPVIGEGGEFLFGLCVPGADQAAAEPGSGTCRSSVSPLLSVAISGRVLSGTDHSQVAAKSRFTAEQQAWDSLVQKSLGESYERTPKQYRWGYKAAPVHCKQREMYIVYEFDFVPKLGLVDQGLPPITVEIPAHTLPPPAQKVEDTWDCSPEKPG